jgi:hypothetical protein
MRKLARVRDCLSLLVLSTRQVCMGHYCEKFSPILSLSLSSCSVFQRPQIVYACLSIAVSSACSSVFSHIFFIRIVLKTSFSLFFFSCVFSITSIMSLYSSVMQQSKRSQKEKKKRKAVAVVAIIVVRICPDRFFLLSLYNKKNLTAVIMMQTKNKLIKK